jgi:hypothetical protein
MTPVLSISIYRSTPLVSWKAKIGSHNTLRQGSTVTKRSQSELSRQSPRKEEAASIKLAFQHGLKDYLTVKESG